jgi:hypothetical protein
MSTVVFDYVTASYDPDDDIFLNDEDNDDNVEYDSDIENNLKDAERDSYTNS